MVDTRRPGQSIGLSVVALILLASVSPTAGQDANLCDLPGEKPDLVVADIGAVARMGTLDDVSSYSFGDTHCNLGTCQVDWIHSSNRHPVTAQNFYRFDGQALEQIGQSWVMHGFFALSSGYCSTDCHPTDGTHLGVKCSDVNSALSESQQQNMGPRSEIDAATGVFPFPFATRGQTGNVLYKRLQVSNSDQDPQLHPGAQFFGEIQMVNADDATAGNQDDNVAYRRVLVVPGSGGTFQWSFSGPTVAKRPAIQAWRDADPAVLLSDVAIPGDGSMTLGARVTALGGGLWRYEYAIQNRTSHRSAASFRVPLPDGVPVSAIGFHDVAYHSGEPYDGTDWAGAVDGPSVRWATSTFDQDPNANALRWGTLYNFRFVAAIPPALGAASVGLFRPGSSSEVAVDTFVPSPCDGDGACEAGETACACFADCGVPLAFEGTCDDTLDDDCDGSADCVDGDCCAVAACPNPDADGDGRGTCDCDDSNASAWGSPGEVQGLRLSSEVGVTRLDWDEPTDGGAAILEFEVLRSGDPVNFLTASDCVADAFREDTSAVDADLPPSGAAFYYAVRAANACPDGTGSIGRRSDGVPRPARACD